jgi:hypothetical protein
LWIKPRDGHVPEQQPEAPVDKSEAENALADALESAQSIGTPAEESSKKASAEDFAGIPSALSEDVAKRNRDAAEMGDVSA